MLGAKSTFLQATPTLFLVCFSLQIIVDIQKNPAPQISPLDAIAGSVCAFLSLSPATPVTSPLPSSEKIRVGEGRAKNTHAPPKIPGKGKHIDGDGDGDAGEGTGTGAYHHRTRWGKTCQKISLEIYCEKHLFPFNLFSQTLIIFSNEKNEFLFFNVVI